MAVNNHRDPRIDAFARMVLKRPWTTIVLSVIVTLVCSFGATMLQISPDSRVFFGKDNPHRINLERLEKTFIRANNVLFLILPEDGNVFTKETLTLVEDLTKRAWKTPFSTRVDSIANFQHSYAKGDEIIVEDLYDDAKSLTQEEIREVRRKALESEELVDRLISPEGDATGVSVLVLRPGDELDEIPRITEFSRDLADQIRQEYPNVRIHLTGGVLGDMAFKEAAERDLRTLAPFMLLLIVVSLWIGYRSFAGMLGTMLVVGFSVGIAMGLAGYFGVILNSATATAPVIIMTLCIADCVHVMTNLSQARRRGMAMDDALKDTIRLNFVPIAITSLTTAVGFMTLNFSDSPPFRELGNIVAVGMVAGFFLSLTFFPAFLKLMPAPKVERLWTGDALMSRLAFFTMARRRTILPVGIVLVLVACGGLTKLVYDDDFVRYFDRSFDFRVDTEILQDRLTGLHALHFPLPSGEASGISKPEYLNKVEAFARWFEKQDHVVHVGAITDVLKRLNKNMHGDDEDFYKVPDDQRLAAQLLFFYEMSVPFGHNLKSRIDVAKSQTLFTVWLRHVSSADIRRLGEAGEQWLKDNAPEMLAPATGLSTTYAHLSERNVRSMMNGTFVALLLISLILLVVLRSVSIGLISLAPNLVPAVTAFGIWGYFVGEVSLAVSVVGAITLGIVVDDTVHFLAKYLRARRTLNMSTPEAIEHTFRTVGAALILTSITLVLGFSVLTLSGFAVSVHMGTLSAIAIVVALMADLTMLPGLILGLEKLRRRKKA